MTPVALAAKDWRTLYVVCEHVAELPHGGDPMGPKTDGLRHQGFAVCCQACYEAGFLGGALETTNEPNGLCVGRLKPQGGAA